MVVINSDIGIDKVQDNTITSAKIVDNTIVVGDVLTSAGIGYKTGDGGSVTQLTSKSTAVMLNKPCGVITMNNAALAAGAEILFTLTNSTLSSNDLLVVHHNSASGIANGDNYRVGCNHITTGVARIFVKNISAGSLSESVVINFAVIKAVGA